jgi:serine/threonine protein kinase
MPPPQANTEPLPGYRLLEPLGKGGFGEVWKCEAPGGLVKAIKFVPGEVPGAADELRALQQIRSIRHPFLLSIERIEVSDGNLIIVMELADRNLEDVQRAHRAEGRAGIPRLELLGYLREAAEVLDLMNQQHQLQHLDVKPSNLFVVAGHVKVADFGLVNSVAELNGNTPAALQLGTITPLYAAPESFVGKVSPASDQYSLAVTYVELLTGRPPFAGKNFRQLALQHLQGVPDLSALPPDDRGAVARALAKEPRDRFPSCGAFVEALTLGAGSAAEVRVPARAYFALEGEAQPPKSTTAFDYKLGGTNSTVVAPAVKPPSGSFPLVEFAGLRLLECLSRQPGGEMWRALTADGRKRFVRFLMGYGTEDAAGGPLARLAQIYHECLATMEIVRDGPNRVGLVYEIDDDNLAARLKQHMQSASPGVPRAELLEHLGAVAAALDELAAEHRLHHLTLSPRSVALVDGKARLLDFGLAELFWVPAGQQAGAFNTRYAAPELFDGRDVGRADQYSLALIFQEMLTGAHAFRNLNARQMANARRRGNPDLGMLPATDRVVVHRALHQDPERRFASCSELIEALSGGGAKANVGRPVAVSPSRPAPAAEGAAGDAVNELISRASESCQVRESRGLQFLLTPEGSILHHCCARLIPSMVPLKLAGFREQLGAELLDRDDDRYLYRVPLSGSLWRRALGMLPSLAVEVRCEFPTGEGGELAEAAIEVWPLDCSKSRSGDLLEEHGVRMVEIVRGVLNAQAERRSQVRVLFEQMVEVAPVTNGEPGEPTTARLRDISPRGMNVMMARRPSSAQVWVVVKLPSRRDPVPIPARVMRVRGEEGRYEIGLAFE